MQPTATNESNLLRSSKNGMTALALNRPDARKALSNAPTERLLAEIDAIAPKLATKLATRAALTLRVDKTAFYRRIDRSAEDAYAYCSEAMTHDMMAEDAVEGIDAFLHKRPPVWRDR